MEAEKYHANLVKKVRALDTARLRPKREVIVSLSSSRRHLADRTKIVDAIFRRGKRHSNYGNDVKKMIRGIVSLIREKYDSSVAIS